MTLGNVAWRELRDAAVAAVHRGWPVVPGEYRIGDDELLDLIPVWVNWNAAAVTDPDRAFALWDQTLAPVLMVCGQGVDALEVPWLVAELMPALAGAGLAVPLLPAAKVAPPTRWLLFVATGSGGTRTELANVGVQLRGEGNWVALPPTRVGWSQVRWAVAPPEGCEITLPLADEVQRVLVDVMLPGLANASRR